LALPKLGFLAPPAAKKDVSVRGRFAPSRPAAAPFFPPPFAAALAFAFSSLAAAAAAAERTLAAADASPDTHTEHLYSSSSPSGITYTSSLLFPPSALLSGS
jgi:hypothetical protein